MLGVAHSPFRKGDADGGRNLVSGPANWDSEAVPLRNRLLAINGELHTPTPDCFLNGITRQTVIGLAKSRGIKVIERAIMPEELANADEVFLTGSAAEVTPVGEIIGAVGHYRFTPGTICRLMWEDYDRIVGKQAAASAA